MHTFTLGQSRISFAEHRETDFRKEEEKKGKKGGAGRSKMIHLRKNNSKQVYMMLDSNWQLQSQFRKVTLEPSLRAVWHQWLDKQWYPESQIHLTLLRWY